MRSLAWFTAGFAVAGLICFYCEFGTAAYIVAACLFAAGVLFLLLPKLFGGQKVLAAVLIGACFGTCWLQFYIDRRIKPAEKLDGEVISGCVEITDYSYETPGGIGADGKLRISNIDYGVRVYLSSKDSLRPGDKIHGDFQLYCTDKHDTNFLQSRGIFFTAFTESISSTEYADSVEFQYFGITLRQKLLNTIDTIFPSDTYGFAKALLIGDSRDLPYEVDIAFRNSGIRHIIAVSGLHVSILLSVVYFLTKRRSWLSALIGLPVLLLFAAIAGFTPSVNRACLMSAIMLIGVCLNREYDSLTSLSFAVLLILLIDPISISSVSLQLSASSVLGIFLFEGKVRAILMETKLLKKTKGSSRKAKLIRWVSTTISVSVSALVFTLPISAFYFQSFSLLSVAANLLTLWLVSYVFCGIGIASILGILWQPLGWLAAWIVSVPMRLVTGIAKLIAGLPVGYVPADNIYMVLFLCLIYVLCFLFWRSKKRSLWVLICLVALGFTISTAASFAESRMDKFRVTVLDVGQGQCILLQSANSCYMVDCGGDSAKGAASAVVRTLWSNGIYKLDGIILTHFDEDHVGGILPLLAQTQADRLYIPAGERTQDGDSITELFPGELCYVETETVLSCGNGTITVFPNYPDASGNECSLCILFQAADCDILITGDRNASGEAQLMAQTDLPDLEALIVGHHGSKSSTSMELLRSTMPEVAIISVGKDNRYGHPDEEILNRLALYGCKVLRTDLHGTIIIRR